MQQEASLPVLTQEDAADVDLTRLNTAFLCLRRPRLREQDSHAVSIVRVSDALDWNEIRRSAQNAFELGTHGTTTEEADGATRDPG